MMTNEIKIIKTKFEMIDIIAGEQLGLEDLASPQYLRALIDATESTYVHLNDAICASLEMCRECAKKRELLSEYLHIFDDIELGRELHDVEEKVTKFPGAIKEIIERINVVLLELK